MTEQRAFPGAPESVPTARHFVSNAVADVPKEIADRAALMVSELATNAVRHGGTDFEVLVDRTPDELYIEIADSGDGSPVVRHASPRDTSGRGLQIVESLADKWGVRASTSGLGKTVWFTISLPEGRPTEDRAGCE
ncbi:MAG TPA: ATP-binding protein [Acidimicrobiales bacterium]